MAESLSKFYQLKDDDLTAANEFRDQVKNLLFENTGEDVATVSDELAIKSLRYVLDSLQTHEDNRLIERLKANQGDGKKALIEGLEEVLKKERADNTNLCNQIIDLRHDLLVSQKVIARLVGE